MTTVACKHEGERGWIMAADSRIGNGETHITRSPKIFVLASRALLGEAGDADARPVRELLGAFKTSRSLPTRQQLADTKVDFEGLWLFQDGTLFRIEIGRDKKHDDWGGQLYEIEGRFTAVGSGANFAIGAMAAGSSAAKAVAIAAQYDLATAAPIKEVVLNDIAKYGKRGKR